MAQAQVMAQAQAMAPALGFLALPAPVLAHSRRALASIQP